MRRSLLLLLALALLGGCTVTTEREGDPYYVTQAREAEFEVGETTTLEVAQALGPPDEIVPRGEELWFLYRFQDRRTSRLRRLIRRFCSGTSMSAAYSRVAVTELHRKG